MKRKCKMTKTQLRRVPTEKGESIEEMLRRMNKNKEQTKEENPPIYTPLADGIIPDYDIRADRFDVAMEAQNKFTASKIAQAAGEPIIENQSGEESGKETNEGKD